ncbi:MAG TPA: anti-sigma factor domain-containing protein [Bacillales bacterium]|nr:anti-sigma factor domain-containing protein [Bacillales bacterium]
MKRGIVMEVKRRKAVVLTENGRFETIRLPKGTTPGVGDKVVVPDEESNVAVRRKSYRWFPAMSTIAAVLIFVVLLGGFFTANPNETIAAYVSYDVNPSFSAAVNGDMQVVSVQTWNQDAATLFAQWDSYRFMELKAFSQLVVEKIAKSGYFKDDSHFLVATTVVVRDQNVKDKVTASLNKVVDSIRSNKLLTGKSVAVTVKTADPETRKKANSHGLSLGKYLLYLSADDKGKNLSIHTVKQSSVAEIEHKMQEDPKSEPVTNVGIGTGVAEEPKVSEAQQDNGKHLGLQKVSSDEETNDNGKHKGWSKPKQDKEHHDNGKHKGWQKEKPDHKESRHAEKKKKPHKTRPHSSSAMKQNSTKQSGSKNHGNPHKDKNDKHQKKQNEARHHNNNPKSKSPKEGNQGSGPGHKELKLDIQLPNLGFQKDFLERDIGSLHIVIQFDKKAE